MSEGEAVDAREPRLAHLATNGAGDTVWRLPLATTFSDLPLAEGTLVYGGLGAATAATLLTIVHAVLFAGRRKRDLRSLLADTTGDVAHTASFDKIFNSDPNWCSLRLTCELAAKAGAPLDEEEKMLLSYFRGVVSSEDLQVAPTPQLYYSYAFFVGFSRGSQDRCRKLYSRCPHSARDMMLAYKTAHSSLTQASRRPTPP
ncbi:uncharacterized protein [Panulirus ornatus]|uniref:uncharacterized protein isoform X2 n=1 Tax=Panulirus ornatus TaxID=150431 RepID=UPI003A88CCBF